MRDAVVRSVWAVQIHCRYRSQKSLTLRSGRTVTVGQSWTPAWALTASGSSSRQRGAYGGIRSPASHLAPQISLHFCSIGIYCASLFPYICTPLLAVLIVVQFA